MIKEPTRLLRRSAGQGRFVGDRDVMPHKEGQGTAPVKEFQERSGELKPGISFGGDFGAGVQRRTAGTPSLPDNTAEADITSFGGPERQSGGNASRVSALLNGL